MLHEPMCSAVMRDQAHLGCFEEDTLLLLVAAPRAVRILLKRKCTLQVAQFLLRLLNQRHIRLLILQVPKQRLLLCNFFLQRYRRAGARHPSDAIVGRCYIEVYAV